MRWAVLGALFLFSVMTYLDRVAIGNVKTPLTEDLGLTNAQMGYVFSAFTLAYGVFEIPTGWLGDRFGPRRVLTHLVVWWSILTALTGVVAARRPLHLRGTASRRLPQRHLRHPKLVPGR